MTADNNQRIQIQHRKTKTKKAEKGCVTKHGAGELEMWRNSLTGWEFWDLYDRVHEAEGGSVVDFLILLISRNETISGYLSHTLLSYFSSLSASW